MQIKKRIMRYRCDNNITDISMFFPADENIYTKLDVQSEKPISQLFPSDKTVYFIEDRSFQLSWPIYHNEQEFGWVYGSSTGGADTVRSIKLCLQDDYGILYYSITVFQARQHTGRTWQVLPKGNNPYNPNIRRIKNLKDDDAMMGFVEIVE